MPNGESMHAGSSSMASPVDSPRPSTTRRPATHSRKRSWPHDEEERIRASKRNRQQGLVPRNGALTAQPFPTMMFPQHQYLPPAPQQALAWVPRPNEQFNAALNTASPNVMAQTHSASLSAEGFGSYQPQYPQPMYAGPVSDQSGWMAPTTQNGPCCAVPPNGNFDCFGQSVDTKSLLESDFIFEQNHGAQPLTYDISIQQSMNPTHAAFVQTFNFNSSYSMHQPSQKTLPMSSPFASTMLSSSETSLKTDETCECGPKCSCVACGTHFNNIPTRHLIGDLNSILVKDDVVGQSEDQSFYNQDSTSPHDFFLGTSETAGTSPGNLPSPANSIGEDKTICMGVVQSEFLEFDGGNQPTNRTDLPTSLNYMTASYSFDPALMTLPDITNLKTDAETDSGQQLFTADLPFLYPLNSTEPFNVAGGDPTETIGDVINPSVNLNFQIDGWTNPTEAFIDLTADEDDPVSPTAPSSCCRK
ncbi:hypothetical protein MMC34_001104 [Xylographa carneopallida]|nr:hypothetical protein [Xylographa carneopallida]